MKTQYFKIVFILSFALLFGNNNIYAQDWKGTLFCQKVSFFIELNPSYNVQNLLKSKLQKLQRKSGTSTKCVMKKKNNSKIFLQRQMCRHHN